MIKGIIFDLGGTLMYFDGNWEEVDRQSTLAMLPFLQAHKAFASAMIFHNISSPRAASAGKTPIKPA